MTSAIDNLELPVYVLSVADGTQRAGMLLTWIMPASLAKADLRVVLVVSKRNHTLQLLERRKKFLLHKLSVSQLQQFFCFGYYSSRERDKFADFRTVQTDFGVKLEGCAAVLACEVLDGFDLPDRKLIYARVVSESLENQLEAMQLGPALAALPESQRSALREKMDKDSQQDEAMLKL
jgi:flavin reductase (DIM6/NTAB) family NADH-FMN oxidoreductase RutF